MLSFFVGDKLNSGKRFEMCWKNSIPKDIFYYRLRDGSSSWDKGSKTRFQQTNICDCLIFDGDNLYTLELKSTKGKSLPFTNIKEHQITDLLWCSDFANIISGFVIEFADLDECYFIEISRFKRFYDTTERKSIPIDFCRENGLKIDVMKLKINRKFDVEKFLLESVEYI